MAACLMLTLFTGPSLDAFVCRDDIGPAVALASAHVQLTADRSDSDRQAGAPIACPHGHCHHSIPFAIPLTVIATLPEPTAEPHQFAATALLFSQGPTGLDRPPRA